MTIGTVPRIRYQPRRASSSERRPRSRREASQARAMRTRSSRKYRTTAAIVPSWMTAVNAAPGSSQPAKAGTIRRWPLLEIGKNSVSPWTRPRTMAWKRSKPRAAGLVAELDRGDEDRLDRAVGALRRDGLDAVDDVHAAGDLAQDGVLAVQPRGGVRR